MTLLLSIESSQIFVISFYSEQTFQERTRMLCFFKDTAVRLENGFSQYSGRVEILSFGQWTTICDQGFDFFDVKVLCRMLNFDFGDQ